jgi:glycosyltransferase involved in cell wall biosynthesis
LKKKLAYVVATPQTYLAFLKGHAEVLCDDYDITLLADFVSEPGVTGFDVVKTIQVGLPRKISIVHDLAALISLIGILRAGKFDIVHSITPKAGLLANVAGLLARSPVRVHTYTGQVWATRRGFSRWLLKTMDKITLSSTTHALADSRSQAKFLTSEGFLKQIRVLGDGAITGVDTKRFRPDEVVCRAVRQQHGLATDDFVFVFLGRLNRDKGVMDLLEGFARADLDPSCKLLIVGPDEGGLAEVIKQSPLCKAGRVVLAGRSSQPERELNAGDALCVPSYREGFGMSVLEAATIGLPAIASRIYGLTDAVVEGETGIMHDAGNIEEIASCLSAFAADPARVRRMGKAARARVIDAFSPERVTGDLRAFYSELCTDE